MKYLVYLIYPAMLVLLFAGSKFSKKDEWNEGFLSLYQTKCIQGLIAVCIMLHHIGQEMCASWQTYKLYPGLEFFVPLGYLFVSVFMFFSGYGLYVSYEKKPGYVSKGFLRKRALPLLIGFYVSGWAFLIARIIMGEKMSPWKWFCYISGYGLPNPYSWFAIVMPLFYLIFYLAFKYCKKNPILVVTICVFIYTFIGTCINHNDYLMRGQWWYNCVHLFWIGLIVGKNREKFLENSKKKYGLKLALSIVGFIAFFNISQIAQGIFSYYGEQMGLPQTVTVLYRWICLVTEMLSSWFFVLSMLLLGLKISIGNKFMDFFGKITLEFYLVHGLIVEFFSYRFCDILQPIVRIKNGALMIIVVTVLSVPLALLLKKVCHIFDKKVKNEKEA